jgi:hypothetical protein
MTTRSGTPIGSGTAGNAGAGAASTGTAALSSCRTRRAARENAETAAPVAAKTVSVVMSIWPRKKTASVMTEYAVAARPASSSRSQAEIATAPTKAKNVTAGALGVSSAMPDAVMTRSIATACLRMVRRVSGDMSLRRGSAGGGSR